MQLDCDKEESMLCVVQRTIKKAELWRFNMALLGSIHTDSGDIFDWLWRRKEGFDLWIHTSAVWTGCAEKNWDLAHRTEKEQKAMTEEQSFVMKGNVKADGLAEEGTDADGEQMAATKVLTIKLEGKKSMRQLNMLRASMGKSRSGKTEMKLCHKKKSAKDKVSKKHRLEQCNHLGKQMRPVRKAQQSCEDSRSMSWLLTDGKKTSM